MSKQLISLCSVAFFLVLLGCAKPKIMLDRVVVLNATQSKITNVKVYHQPTRKSGEVNAILPQMTLDIGFAGKPMMAHKATVSWRDGAGVDREANLELPYDHAMAKQGRIMDLIYVIRSSGAVTAHLEQSNTMR